MRILLWHVHGAWTTAFVHGSHDYVVPVLPERGPDGVGIARTYEWPDSVSELSPEQLASMTDYLHRITALTDDHRERLDRRD